MNFDFDTAGQQLTQLILATLVMIRFGADLRRPVRPQARQRTYDRPEDKTARRIDGLHLVEVLTELFAAALVILALAQDRV